MKAELVLSVTFLFVLHDLSIWHEYNNAIQEVISKVNSNLNDELTASDGIDRKFTLICLSGCKEEDLSYQKRTMYRIEFKFAYLFTGIKPSTVFLYNRQ